MKAIQVHRHGGPEVLELREVGEPAAGDAVTVRLAWAGLNYVDIYQREGRYPGITLPFQPGMEGSGSVLAAPAGSGWSPGDRVAFTTGVLGSYAEQLAVPAGHLVRVPAAITLQQASAVLEHGLTADMLVQDVARFQPGDTALVHAAAGGVGGLLVQMLLARGLRVLGTVSSAAKADWLHGLGATPLRYDDGHDWMAEVDRLTAGRGVALVFDSVGQTTFAGSLQALAPCGHLVLFGAASGQVAPVDPVLLMRKSATLSRPVLPHYLGSPELLRARAARLFDAVAGGGLHLRIHATLPLAEAGQAQALLASRSTQGKVLLRVGGEL